MDILVTNLLCVIGTVVILFVVAIVIWGMTRQQDEEEE